MCVNYITVSRQIAFDWFRTPIEVNGDWRDEIYRDHQAPFIIHDEQNNRKGLIGTYAFVPQDHRPLRKLTADEQAKYARAVEKAKAQGKEPPGTPRIPMETMNARFEEVTGKMNYKRFWLQQQLCIVPAMTVFEPNWETGKHERWAIELANGEPFGLPGMWRTWEEKDGTVKNTFTHFTLNANDHPLLKRFHSDKEKRGVAILRPQDYDDWLSSTNPEFARALVQLYPAELLKARPAPKATKAATDEANNSIHLSQANQGSLF